MSDQERIEVIRRTVEDCIKYSRSSCTWGHEADIKFMLERYDALAAELAETKALWHERSGTVRLHEIRIRALEAELNEQARVNGMGGSREAALLAKVARLEKALYNVVHCSLEPGVVKRAEIALGLVTAETSAQRARVPTTNHANLNEACQEILRVLATEKEQK